MSAEKRKKGLHLRGEGQHLRLFVPDVFKGGEFASEAEEFLMKAAPIMNGAGIVVDLGGGNWNIGDIISVVDLMIAPLGAKVTAWAAEDPLTLSWMQKCGFSIDNGVSPEYPVAGNREAERPILLVEESLRSGRKVENGGDVIVLGNVNEGSEILAGGSVVVMGRLRGLAHAGIDFEDRSLIVAGHFEATQVRIGSRISCIDENSGWWGKPVSMRVIGGSIVVREMLI